MANSRVGNYQLEFLLTGFTSPTRTHSHSIYVAPLTAPVAGTPVADIDVQQRGGGSTDLQSAANTYSGFLRRFYSTAIDVENFTLWRYVTENSRDFVTAGVAVPGVAGTGAITIAQQNTLSYRTAGGAVLKQVMLESNQGGDAKSTLTADAAGNTVQRMAGYLMSSGGVAIGIDNTFPIAPLTIANGQNEKVWRKIYRG